jgi:hypothetical protein
LECGSGTLGRIFFEAAEDDALDERIEFFDILRGRSGRGFFAGLSEFLKCGGGEGAAAGEIS